MRRAIIAIDGPAGSGKSTIARLVAQRLGYLYIDTGAMYRAVAVKAIEAGIPIEQPERIVELANRLDIHFRTAESADARSSAEIGVSAPPRCGQQRIFADGDDLTEAVRTPEATRLSSPVSAIPGVRHRLVELQRKMGQAGGVVMEGRDIGTYVFPDAEVKIFLTASFEERVRRRRADLEAAGLPADPQTVAKDLRERDHRDSNRSMAPLRQAEDAVLINTDGMTIEEVVREVLLIADC